MFVKTLDDRECRFYPSINGGPAFSCTPALRLQMMPHTASLTGVKNHH